MVGFGVQQLPLVRKLRVWRLTKTLEMFQAEWSDLDAAGMLPTADQIVPFCSKATLMCSSRDFPVQSLPNCSSPGPSRGASEARPRSRRRKWTRRFPRARESTSLRPDSLSRRGLKALHPSHQHLYSSLPAYPIHVLNRYGPGIHNPVSGILNLQ